MCYDPLRFILCFSDLFTLSCQPKTPGAVRVALCAQLGICRSRGSLEDQTGNECAKLAGSKKHRGARVMPAAHIRERERAVETIKPGNEVARPLRSKKHRGTRVSRDSHQRPPESNNPNTDRNYTEPHRITLSRAEPRRSAQSRAEPSRITRARERQRSARR